MALSSATIVAGDQAVFIVADGTAQGSAEDPASEDPASVDAQPASVALVMIGAEEEHNPYTEAMKRKT